MIKSKYIFLRLGVLFRFLRLTTRKVRLWALSFWGFGRLLIVIIFGVDLN